MAVKMREETRARRNTWEAGRWLSGRGFLRRSRVRRASGVRQREM
jgi:hypothetical protein